MADQKVRRRSRAATRGVGGAAGQTLKQAGGAARAATSSLSDVTGTDLVEEVGRRADDAVENAGDTFEDAGGGGDQRTVRGELREIVREAALEVLAPVARRATTQAAMYALRRGPQLARDTIAPRLAETLGPAIEEAGGPGAFARGALSSVADAREGMLEKLGIGGERAESKRRPWQERRLPLEQSVDVVASLEMAFELFTEFDEYAKFLSEGEITDSRRDERLMWRRGDGVQASAVISFHRLSDRLTRVMVTYEYQPDGLLEKTTAVFRGNRRALNTDLMRFKAFVEMEGDGTEDSGDGQQSEDEAPRTRTRGTSRRPEPQELETDEDEYDEEDEEEPEGEYEEEDLEGEYEEELDEQDEEEPDQQDEEAPTARKQPARRRSVARPRQQKARRR